MDKCPRGKEGDLIESELSDVSSRLPCTGDAESRENRKKDDRNPIIPPSCCSRRPRQPSTYTPRPPVSYKIRRMATTFLPRFELIINQCRRTPTNVTIHPVALFSILDHYLRRTEKQDRVLGTLLGTRNDSEVQVRSSFAVLHSETSEQVAVDMDYHRAMYDLHHKVNPKEVIVGWCVALLFLR